MARSRSWGLVALSLALSLAAADAAHAQIQPERRPFATSSARESRPAGAEELTCTVYALGALAEDPGFGKWVADTIPEVIEPGNWAQAGGGRQRLSYYAPAKVLVVYHTPAVQAKVAAFLRDLKKAAPEQPQQVMAPADETPAPPLDRAVVPARYTATDAVKAQAPLAADRSAYLVPAPVKAPKHLFHLILRYEGQGVSDSAVAGIVTQLGGEVTPAEEPKAGAAPGKGMQQNALLNFIVRYEGEGIIDSNVASLLKDLYKMNVGADTGARPSCGPVTSVGPVAPSGLAPATYAVPTNSAPPGVGVSSGSGLGVSIDTAIGSPAATGNTLSSPSYLSRDPVVMPPAAGPSSPTSSPAPLTPRTMPPAR